MERPNHLKVGDKSVSSKAGSIAIVVGIHIAVIFGLIAALNQFMERELDAMSRAARQRVDSESSPCEALMREIAALMLAKCSSVSRLMDSSSSQRPARSTARVSLNVADAVLASRARHHACNARGASHGLADA